MKYFCQIDNVNKQKRYFSQYIPFAPNIFQRRTRRAFETRSITFSVLSEHVRHRNLRNLDIYACLTLKEYSIHQDGRSRKRSARAIINSLSKVNSTIVKNLGETSPIFDTSATVSSHSQSGIRKYFDEKRARNVFRDFSFFFFFPRTYRVTGEKTALFADAEEHAARIERARKEAHTQQMHASPSLVVSRARPEAPVQSR